MHIHIVRYTTRTEALADENQRLAKEVFTELNADNPGGLRYGTFRLGDGLNFIHVVAVEGDVDPLPTSAAFNEFRKDIGNRVTGPPVRDEATLIGSYRFLAT